MQVVIIDPIAISDSQLNVRPLSDQSDNESKFMLELRASVTRSRKRGTLLKTSMLNYMSKPRPGEELPQTSSAALSYLPQIKMREPWKTGILLALLMLTAAGIIITPPTPQSKILLLVLCGLEIIWMVLSFIFTIGIVKAKRTVRTALEDTGSEFRETALTRYGVTLTELITYQLAQGKATSLYNAEGVLTRMMLVSNSDNKTSKLFTVE